MKKEIKDFLIYLSSEKGLSPHTLSAYGRDLSAFAEFMKEKSFGTQDQIIEYFQMLKRKGVMTSTFCRALVAIKGFFRFLKKEGIIPDNPTQYLESPKQWQLIPEVLSIEETGKLLLSPDDRSLIGARDKAILHILYASGLRASELCNLNIEDVSDDRIRVRGRVIRNGLFLLPTKQLSPSITI